MPILTHDQIKSVAAILTHANNLSAECFEITFGKDIGGPKYRLALQRNGYVTLLHNVEADKQPQPDSLPKWRAEEVYTTQADMFGAYGIDE